MKAWIKYAAPVAVVSLIALFAWVWVEYLQQRPWPPELNSPGATFQSGDVYTFTWIPAATGPKAEFYYLQQSTNKNFSSPTAYKVAHQAAGTQQQSGQIVAPEGPVTYYYRIVAGYTSKYFSPADILSDPSNVVSISITPLPTPSVLPITKKLYSGEDYTISWTSITKANAYLLEEKRPDGATKDYKPTTTSHKFVAPPLKQDGSFSYRVKAANAAGSKWVYITGWSNQQSIMITHVEPPPNLKVSPSSVHYPNKYQLSWGVPTPGPQPTTSYTYSLREKKSSQPPKVLAAQSQTTYTAAAPKVTSSTTHVYEVMAYFGKNPMTFFSSPVSVTITPPPPPPPPQITSVSPDMAPIGTEVTINGKYFSGAKLELYSSATGKSITVTPKSLTADKVVFKVPSAASLKTTHVQLIVNKVTVKKAFQVTRATGKFVERQDKVQPKTHTCGKFTAEVDWPPKQLNIFTGRFKQGTTPLINFATGFKGTNMVKSGLGFSKNCKVGVMVAATTGGLVQPAYVNFYNIGFKVDSQTNPGTKISGPHGIEPSAFYVEGYKLLFSPDDTIAAVVNRNKLGPTKLWIYIVDMLTGKQLYADGFNNPMFSLSVDKKNNISFKPSGAQSKLIKIPTP